MRLRDGRGIPWAPCSSAELATRRGDSTRSSAPFRAVFEEAHASPPLMASALLTAALVALAAVLAVLYGQPLLALFASSMDSSAPQNRTVVVVGGGLAGMSAALEAAMTGASVVLIDKEKACVFLRDPLERVAHGVLPFASLLSPHPSSLVVSQQALSAHTLGLT